MEKFVSKKGVSVYAYQGDAMTLLAFDLDESLTENFVCFTVHVNADGRNFYIYNKMKFKEDVKLHRTPTRASEYLTETQKILAAQNDSVYITAESYTGKSIRLIGKCS